MYVKHVDTGCS